MSHLSRLYTSHAESVSSNRKPQKNDDQVYQNHEKGLFILCDGAGAAGDGGKAAEFICDTLSNEIPTQIQHKKLKKALYNTDKKLCKSHIYGKSTASIIQLSLDFRNRLICTYANAADSRIYTLTDEILTCLTHDNIDKNPQIHQTNLRVQHIFDNITSIHELQDEELMKKFQKRNSTFNLLGHAPHEIQIESNSFFIQNQEIILLTSDGIHDNLTHTEIQNILCANFKRGAEYIAQTLITAAKERVGNFRHIRSKDDDISCIVILFDKNSIQKSRQSFAQALLKKIF